MAKVFLNEDIVKEIIRRLYQKNEVAGLICELCWLRNFRVGDVRHARASHFRKDNGHPKFYLCYDKLRSNQWYPIPESIYNKINQYIKENNLKKNNHVFEITCMARGPYHGHKGVITHEWMQKLWLNICKDLGIFTSTIKEYKRCSKCKYTNGNGKCKVLSPRIKNCSSIDIKHCIKKGKTRTTLEKHPRLHETLRGAGAKAKIRHYMNQGFDYETALLKVFHMSNWRSWKVFKQYMDAVFEKEIGDETFIRDFGNKILIES